MTSPKPKVRKVAWVVLGVIVLGAAISLASVWDTVLLSFLYQDYKTLEVEWMYGSEGGDMAGVTHKWQGQTVTTHLEDCPRGAVKARFLSKTVKWLPGPESVVVFLDEQDEIISHRSEVFLP